MSDKVVGDDKVPDFPKQAQEFLGTEERMDPKPDYGYDSYKGSGKMKGKTALVTGGDSGIGKAIVLHFAREGANVAIAYLNEHQDAEATKKVVEEAGVQALLLPGDLRSEDQCKKIVKETVDKFGQLDVLVNNASYQGKDVDNFEDITRERLEFTFHSNILAYFSVAQAAVPHMPKGSAIINIASIQGYQPSFGVLDYACTKGAMTTFTKGLGPHLISRGIRVNAIAPGPVWTPLIQQSYPPEEVAKFGKQTPIGRPGQPKEYGPVAVFLATEADSSYIVGAIVGVTGGGPIN
ncbi:hypothetical protein ABBQ38_003958 [Trebouxia sp. C0009 RCD-2024]